MSPLARIILGLRTQYTSKAHCTIRKAIGSNLPVLRIQTMSRTLGMKVEVICYSGLKMGVISSRRFPTYLRGRPRGPTITSPHILRLALETPQFPARILSRGRTAAQGRSQTQEPISRRIWRECQANSITATDVNTPTQPTKNNTQEFRKCGMVP